MKAFIVCNLALWFLSLGFSGLLAQEPKIGLEQQSSLFWKISGNGLKKASYLYGTIHMICPEHLQIKPEVLKQLEKSDQVVFEVDIDKPETGSIMGKLFQNSMDTASLEHYLTPQEHSELISFFKDSLGLPREMLKAANPMILSLTLLPKLLNCIPASTEQRLLKHLNEVVKKRKKVKILGLETLEQQMGFLQTVSFKEQVVELYTVVKNFQSYQTKMNTLLTLYRQQNLEGLKQMMDEMPGDMSSLLVTKRNAAWIPVMERMMKNTTSFFAVGAGHLPGGDGLLTLLRNKGYAIEPVFR